MRREGWILQPEGWIEGRIEFGRRILRLEGHAAEAPGAGPRILPGFVDLHVHGGGGADLMEGPGALRQVARTHARHGTTSMLATTVTAPVPELEKVLRGIREGMDSPGPGESRVLGVHLEGPFLNPARLGAQPPFTVAANLAEVMALHALAPLRVLTLAPECEGHLDLIPQVAAAGIRVQIGHSDASYEQARAALAAGAAGFTHLFNAMSPFHHRAPGVAGAALAHGEFAELIPDLIHVHEGAIRAALRAIPNLYAVTDGTAASAMPDGEYRLGSHRVSKCANGVRLADGTLAGSCLTMHQAFRNLVSLGLSLQEASRRCSAIPAAFLGESGLGVLREGSPSDLLVLDESLALQEVFIEGSTVPGVGGRAA
jgi:N-acetylglucosamine-6-phosphate deacetylase